MKSLAKYLSLLLIGLALVGCGSSQANLPKTDVGSNIPDWFLNTPKQKDYLFAAKTETSRDLQLAIDKATSSARADISRQIETQLSSLEKNFKEEVGSGEDSQLISQFTSAIKTVSIQTLTGSNIRNKKIIKDGNTYRAYVLVEYPIGEANQALMNALKKNEQMYTRFRASKTFEELDKEIKQYEDKKEKDNQDNANN